MSKNIITIQEFKDDKVKPETKVEINSEYVTHEQETDMLANYVKSSINRFFNTNSEKITIIIDKK